MLFSDIACPLLSSDHVLWVQLSVKYPRYRMDSINESGRRYYGGAISLPVPASIEFPATPQCLWSTQFIIEHSCIFPWSISPCRKVLSPCIWCQESSEQELQDETKSTGVTQRHILHNLPLRQTHLKSYTACSNTVMICVCVCVCAAAWPKSGRQLYLSSEPAMRAFSLFSQVVGP